MNQSAKQVDVSVDEFRRRAQRTNLGRLYFPNGHKCGPPEYVEQVPFFVTLRDLYSLIAEGEIGQSPINFDDILGIIAFGSAVGNPTLQAEAYTRKKYFLFGPEITLSRVRLKVPEDVDFLVITKTDSDRESKIAPSWVNGYDSRCLRKGGLHIQVGGRARFLDGVKQGDTVCISALEQGVPVFTTPEFDALVLESGIQSRSSRKTYWELDNGAITGWIK
jgi:hypothetical protein